MNLKYGMNPNQKFAEIETNDALQVLNGKPSFINFLDGLNSWQLVSELDKATGFAVATSFKHVTPAGVGLGTAFAPGELASYHLPEVKSPLAIAYLKARGSDRLASFGDFIALSRKVDVETATIIGKEVSDGIIAPAYEPAALELLKAKKKGAYVILQIDPAYQAPAVEERTVFGFKMRQDRNMLNIDASCVSEIMMGNKNLSAQAIQNLITGLITLKFAQSNSVCVVQNGHAIGIGSGQQSRILCSELALSKSLRWYQKTTIAAPSYPEKATRTEKDQLLEVQRLQKFGSAAAPINCPDLVLCSDGFFPHEDNIEAAHAYGVKIIAAPMGSVKDAAILAKCEKYGITFIKLGFRLFHHG